jgi:hypothetical protein
VLGKSDYKAHEGVNTGGANAVYWVNIVLKRPDGLVVVRNITEGAKVKVDEVTEPIEPDLLYPLLRGRDVQRWKAEPSAYIIVTHKPGMRLNAIPEKEMQECYPRTYGYFKRFEQTLLKRGGWEVKQMMKAGKPFYSMSEIGDYTFAPWKVVWLGFGATEMQAAVVGLVDGKPVMTNQAMHPFVPLDREDEAHYLCACLNSSVVNLAVISHTQLGGKSFAQSNILEHIRISRFDPKNPVHLRLAELSMQAHEAARIGDEMRLREIEAEIDRWAAKLWNLTDDELRDIQQSLAELSETPEPADEE